VSRVATQAACPVLVIRATHGSPGWDEAYDAPDGAGPTTVGRGSSDLRLDPGAPVRRTFSTDHRTGSAEALELAEQLSMWHDDMVVHARAVARGHVAVCDDSCPHAQAVELWRAAREVLGEAADRLSFLKAAALRRVARGISA
jgi:hypothetical protein